MSYDYWCNFFRQVVELEPDAARQFSEKFVNHKILPSHLKSLTRQILHDMGIEAIGHQMSIIEKSKELDSNPIKDRAVNNCDKTRVENDSLGGGGGGRPDPLTPTKKHRHNRARSQERTFNSSKSTLKKHSSLHDLRDIVLPNYEPNDPHYQHDRTWPGNKKNDGSYNRHLNFHPDPGPPRPGPSSAFPDERSRIGKQIDVNRPRHLGFPPDPGPQRPGPFPDPGVRGRDIPRDISMPLPDPLPPAELERIAKAYFRFRHDLVASEYREEMERRAQWGPLPFPDKSILRPPVDYDAKEKASSRSNGEPGMMDDEEGRIKVSFKRTAEVVEIPRVAQYRQPVSLLRKDVCISLMSDQEFADYKKKMFSNTADTHHWKTGEKWVKSPVYESE